MPVAAPRDRASLPLPASFYAREPVSVARDLLGKLLVRTTSAGLCSGVIVEVEAYLSSRDPACHAARGLSKKNAAMFGPPGRAYVYMIHARWCLNAVTEAEGTPSAILIRAIEPREGIPLMQQRRRTEIVRDLARGPARLCEALAIDCTYNHWDLTSGNELWIAADPAADEHNALDRTAIDRPAPPLRIARSGRIGISSAQRRLLRFYLAGNPFVSGRRAINR